MYAQLLFNPLVSGLLLALVAIGFNLIFNTTKVFHLAHGALYVFAPYMLIQLLAMFPVDSIFTWIASFIGSLIVVMVLSWLIEWLVYQPLTRKKSGQAITLISSIGVYLFLINLIAMLYGNETKFLDPHIGKEGFTSISHPAALSPIPPPVK